LTSDLKTLPIEHVIARGQTVARMGVCEVDCPHLDWPRHARNTVHMGPAKTADAFEIKAPEGVNTVRANVIGVVENQAPTKALKVDLPVTNGRVETTDDVCQIALVERHRASGAVVNGFVSGFGYSGKMAMASTVAHDSHHMIVVGTDRAMMAAAANRLSEVGGGVTVWKDGAELALVELPIAGLMSDEPAKDVARKAETLALSMLRNLN